MPVLLSLILTVPLLASPQDKTPKDDSNVEAVLVGEIKKIDRKNNTLTVTSPREITLTRGNRGGGGGGRGRGSGGGGSTGGGGGTGPLSSGAATVESKVSYSTATAVKEEDKTLAIQDLHIGDFVRITEHVKGKKTEATEIDRTPHPNG